MISKTTFGGKMATLKACLPARSGTVQEWSRLLHGYDLAITRARVAEVDFIEACDRLLYLDEWFPTAARIVAVADECRRERRQEQRAALPVVTTPTRLVCPYCHGARWLRRRAAPAEPCPHCTTDGRYDYGREQSLIAAEGGVPDPAGTDYMPDMSKTTWRLPRTATGQPDMDAVYQESRRLRGLPPGDDRERGSAGWRTMGDSMTLAAVVEQRAPATTDPDDDEWPF